MSPTSASSSISPGASAFTRPGAGTAPSSLTAPWSGQRTRASSPPRDHKYSWAKAPRYGENPAETGPLAELILARDPLIHDFMASEGPSTLLRQLARILRPAYLIPAAQTWLGESSEDGPYYVNPGPIPDGSGAGLVEASRGALGHWISVKGGKIDHYQIITPTGWNASPRDTAGMRGPLEEALIGTPVEDCENPVLAGFVVRSFDPCLVCTVHSIDRGRSRRRVTFRM
ncbi:MAG: nickel-dependent hydrogenase large subunit [Thermoanaerobaculia bacterium]|nr:nickel-dependent hydrogenase large subunit [Thermoanaerobaculia bacterium]